MADPAHKFTDERIEQIKAANLKRLKAVEAANRKRLEKYLASKENALKTARERLESGETTKEEHQLWCQTNIFGKEWKKLLEEMAREITKANREAVASINDATASIYAENYNYGLFQVQEGVWRM